MREYGIAEYLVAATATVGVSWCTSTLVHPYTRLVDNTAVGYIGSRLLLEPLDFIDESEAFIQIDGRPFAGVEPERRVHAVTDLVAIDYHIAAGPDCQRR